jgi:hypothetical protein
MKNSTTNESFSGAGERATPANSAGKKSIPAAALVALFLAILSISGCTGIAGAPKTSSVQQPAPTPTAATMSVAPEAIKFGSVAVGESASQSVTVSNDGGSNLTVTQASSTAAGVTVSGIALPLTIEAGKKATFNVVFSPKTAGTLSGNVSVMSDISSSPATVSLSGTGMASTALLNTSASSLSFGNVSLGKSSALSVTLTNVGNSNVTVSQVIVSGARYSASGVSAGLILAPGQSATLEATFAPSAAGQLQGSVTVASNASNSPATIALSGDGTQAASPAVSHSVVIAWAPSTSAVAGYDVYRSEVSGGPYAKLDASIVTADSYTDSSVQGGQTYYYVITSVTSTGVQSADSTQASAVIPNP